MLALCLNRLQYSKLGSNNGFTKKMTDVLTYKIHTTELNCLAVIELSYKDSILSETSTQKKIFHGRNISSVLVIKEKVFI